MADLDRARSDVAAFAEAADAPLRDWQARALALDQRITTILAPRQSGKSRSLAILGLWWAFRSPEQRVLIVSAGEEAARRLLAEVRRIAAASPLLAGSLVDEQAGLVTLSNGSEIRSVPASERQVRGWTVDLLLADEAGLIPDDLLLGAALPTTAARPNARIVLAGSATVASGAFFDHYKIGESDSEHVQSFRWALTDADWIAPSVIQAARESMTETRFAAEYEGVFASGSDALFTRQALDRVTADYRCRSLSELCGPARVLAGVDWGYSNDRSAIVAIAKLPEAGPRRFGIVCAHRWPAGEQLGGDVGVIADIVGAPTHYARLTAELNGLGAPCFEELRRRIRERAANAGGGQRRRFFVDAEDLDDLLTEQARLRRPRRPEHQRFKDARRVPAPEFQTKMAGVHSSAEVKAASYMALRMAIDREHLLIPASATELIRELLLLRVDLSPSGTERIEASSGHDDLADAAMLSLGPYKNRRGPARTVLGDLIDRSSVLSPDELPERESTASTGGGIELPRVPILQSVGGYELTDTEVETVEYGGFHITRPKRHEHAAEQPNERSTQ